MERILINGDWYVKESTSEEIVNDYTFTNSCILETDNFCFEATRCMKDDNIEYYPDITMDLTKKEGDRKNWKIESWDNPDFLRGILDGDDDCLRDLSETVSEPYDIRVFIQMLVDLKEKGWL